MPKKNQQAGRRYLVPMGSRQHLDKQFDRCPITQGTTINT
jgi:hypothetical protein